MGIESFFIKLLPYGVRPVRVDGCLDFEGRSVMLTTAFRSKLHTLPLSVTPYSRMPDDTPYEFVIDEALILSTGYDGRWLKEITLVGCMAWYEEAVQGSFRLASFIHERIIPITVGPPLAMEFAPTSESQFLSEMTRTYGRKREAFRRDFDDIHVQVLPHEFYNVYRHHCRQQRWGKWLSLSGWRNRDKRS